VQVSRKTKPAQVGRVALWATASRVSREPRPR
jgi:hypothetical protein